MGASTFDTDVGVLVVFGAVERASLGSTFARFSSVDVPFFAFA